MIYFLAGLPRSGSSLLSALLRQHPDLHVSPTSGLVDMVVMLRDGWARNDCFRSQGLATVLPRIRGAIRGLIEGFYDGEFSQGKHVIDKSRAWPAYIELLEEALEGQMRIICPIRDVREIVASFERLRHRHPMTAPHGNGDEYIIGQDVYGRVEAMLAPGGVVGLPIRRLRDAINRGLGNRLHVVRHRDIIEDPVSVCVGIFAFLGLKPIQVNPSSLEEVRHPLDMDVWGMPLHKIGYTLDRSRPQKGWRDVLPDDLAESVHHQFPFIQNMVGDGTPCMPSTASASSPSAC